MTDGHNVSSARPIRLRSSVHVGILVCLVAVFSYLAARLGGALVLRPEMIWPLWPGCAFLVSVLLLTEPKILWPAFLASGLAGFALYDIGEGLTIRSTCLFLLADTVEILIAALGVSFVFAGLPCLNSVKSLAKYSFFAVFLAPVSVAAVSAIALGRGYPASWKINFLTEALALLTLTPAILGWASNVTKPAKKPWTSYLESAVMLTALLSLAYFTFATGGRSRPALLYSLVPILLWSALRFGVLGTSNSMIVIAFFSIWGVTHGHGPFSAETPVRTVLSLQLFLLFAAASFMVLAALAEERKSWEDKLREYERVVENSEDMIAVVDRAYRYSIANRQFLKMQKVTRDQVVGRFAAEVLSPVFFEAVVKPKVDECFQGKVVQYETKYTYADIGERQLSISYFPIDGSHGIDRVACILQDITERKRAEEALAAMSGKLIEAQEQERIRISRELHDDIAQRLALLANELQQVELNAHDSDAELRTRIIALRRRTAEISSDVQTMSHELHSSKLEYLGIVAAMKAFCREFGQRQEMEIDFKGCDLPRPLSPEISLCLFRVLQEALHNAAKHSGVRHFHVELGGSFDEIHLTVSDSGRGFDFETALQGGGLGLVSMRERVRLVKGIIVVESKPKAGTTIDVRVPYGRSSHTTQAAG